MVLIRDLLTDEQKKLIKPYLNLDEGTVFPDLEGENVDVEDSDPPSED